ncbi:MAG: DNA polymerase III subunit delta' [Lachnospiraceae bacterium]|nr:DNA polymerase III subunit delta' [Lachnospiraceae bacterium]
MKNFNDILGHDNIKEHLQTAINMGKLSHAYIFSGEEGSGKKTVAEIFAAALMCSGEEKPCGMCMSCMQAESHNHPDIVYVTHEKSRIGVDEIRVQLINDIVIKPFSSPHKVYIIDEAERMTEQAQNALLKTLEEPPEYAVIILLTTNTGSFLQTILSRCVTIQFKPLDNKLIVDYLMKNQQLPDYYAKVCASFSAGSLGKAIKYAGNPEFEKVKQDVLGIVKNIDEAPFDELVSATAVLSENKAMMDDYIDLMHLWFRDILMFKATQDANRIIFIDELMQIKQMASRYSFEGLGKIADAFYKVRDRLKANVNFETAIEMLFLSMREH